MSKKKLTLSHLTKEVQDFDEREGINNGYDVAMFYAINGNTNMYEWLSEYNNETLVYLNSQFINHVHEPMTYAENKLMRAIHNVLCDRLHIKAYRAMRGGNIHELLIIQPYRSTVKRSIMKKDNTTLKSLVSAGLCSVDFDDESTYVPIYLGGLNNDHDTTYMRAIDVLAEYGDLPIYPINIHDDYYQNVFNKLDSTRIVADLYLNVDDFNWYASSRVDSDPRFVFGLW